MISDETDTLELMDRYSFLVQQYTKLALEIAPLMDKFGKIKQELEIITAEFIKRGVKPNDPESLKAVMEEALKERGMNNASEPQTNKV